MYKSEVLLTMCSDYSVKCWCATDTWLSLCWEWCCKFKHTHHILMSGSRYTLTYCYQLPIDQFQWRFTGSYKKKRESYLPNTLDCTCWIKAVQWVSHLFNPPAVSKAEMDDGGWNAGPTNHYTTWFACLAFVYLWELSFFSTFVCN